jgi:hypothetical protein
MRGRGEDSALADIPIGPIAAPVPEQAAHVVQTLTTDLIIRLHANQPYPDSQQRPNTI